MNYKAIALLLALVQLVIFPQQRAVEFDVWASKRFDEATLKQAAQPIIDFYSDWNAGWISAIHYVEADSLERNEPESISRMLEAFGMDPQTADYVFLGVDLYWDKPGASEPYYLPSWNWFSAQEKGSDTWRTAYWWGTFPYDDSYGRPAPPQKNVMPSLAETLTRAFRSSYLTNPVKLHIEESRIYDRETLLQAMKPLLDDSKRWKAIRLEAIYYSDEVSLRELGYELPFHQDPEGTEYVFFEYDYKIYLEIPGENSPGEGSTRCISYREPGSDTWTIRETGDV
jgi:hypothetical protein